MKCIICNKSITLDHKEGDLMKCLKESTKLIATIDYYVNRLRIIS